MEEARNLCVLVESIEQCVARRRRAAGRLHRRRGGGAVPGPRAHRGHAVQRRVRRPAVAAAHEGTHSCLLADVGAESRVRRFARLALGTDSHLVEVHRAGTSNIQVSSGRWSPRTPQRLVSTSDMCQLTCAALTGAALQRISRHGVPVRGDPGDHGPDHQLGRAGLQQPGVC